MSAGSIGYLWINDHIVCPADDFTAINIPFQANQSMTVRWEYTFTEARGPATFALLYSTFESAGSMSLIPIQYFSPNISDFEVERQSMRDRQINAGWGTFVNKDMLSHVR